MGRIIIEPKFISKREVEVFWSGKYRRYILAIDMDVIELTPRQYDAVLKLLRVLFNVREEREEDTEVSEGNETRGEEEGGEEGR